MIRIGGGWGPQRAVPSFGVRRRSRDLAIGSDGPAEGVESCADWRRKDALTLQCARVVEVLGFERVGRFALANDGRARGVMAGVEVRHRSAG